MEFFIGIGVTLAMGFGGLMMVINQRIRANEVVIERMEKRIEKLEDAMQESSRTLNDILQELTGRVIKIEVKQEEVK